MQTIPRTTITTIQVRADVVIENVVTRDHFDGQPCRRKATAGISSAVLKTCAAMNRRRITLVEGD